MYFYVKVIFLDSFFIAIYFNQFYRLAQSTSLPFIATLSTPVDKYYD